MVLVLFLQLIETSSWCLQLCLPQPLWLQLKMWVSDPVHATSSSQICPVPPPYLFPSVTPNLFKMCKQNMLHLKQTSSCFNECSATRNINHHPSYRSSLNNNRLRWTMSNAAVQRQGDKRHKADICPLSAACDRSLNTFVTAFSLQSIAAVSVTNEFSSDHGSRCAPFNIVDVGLYGMPHKRCLGKYSNRVNIHIEKTREVVSHACIVKSDKGLLAQNTLEHPQNSVWFDNGQRNLAFQKLLSSKGDGSLSLYSWFT